MGPIAFPHTFPPHPLKFPEQDAHSVALLLPLHGRANAALRKAVAVVDERTRKRMPQVVQPHVI